MGNKESNPGLSEVQKNFAFFDAQKQLTLLTEVLHEYDEKERSAAVDMTGAFLEYSSVLAKNLSPEDQTLLLTRPRKEKSFLSRKERLVAPFNWEYYYLGINAHLSVMAKREDSPLYQELLKEEPEELPISAIRIAGNRPGRNMGRYPLEVLIEEEDTLLHLAKITPGKNHLNLKTMDKIVEIAKRKADTGVFTTNEEATWVSEREMYLAQVSDLKNETNPNLKAKLHNASLAVNKLLAAGLLEIRRIQEAHDGDRHYSLDLRTGSIVKEHGIDPERVDYTEIAPLYARILRRSLAKTAE